MTEGNPLQRTAEWLRDRTGCLTASRFADVMARKRDGSPTKAYYDLIDTLIAERVTGDSIGIGTTAAMQWGIDHEDEARAEYEAQTGSFVDLCGFIPHPTVDWLGASPDGLVGSDGLVEIKCPYSTVVHLRRIAAKVVPEEYRPQMLLQLICTGRKWCDFVDFDPRLIGGPYERLAFWTIRFEPTEEERQQALALAKDFLAEVDSKLCALLEKPLPAKKEVTVMDIKKFAQHYEDDEVEVYPDKFDYRAWFVAKDKEGKYWGIYTHYDPESGYSSLRDAGFEDEKPELVEPIYGITDFKRVKRA